MKSKGKPNRDQAPHTLAGQTALITGAAQRLGRALSLALADEGVHLVLHYHRSAEAVESLADTIRGKGVSCWPIAADLTQPGKVETLWNDAVDATGTIHILINNASIFHTETLAQVTPESFQRNMQIHALTPLVLSRRLGQQEGPGHIINLLDTRAVCRDPQHVSYHLSKRTLLSLTRLLAEELGPTVAVNGVAPGLILAPAGEDETYLERLRHTNPLHRYGGPDDITDAVLYLLRSRFITGQIIYVDGGHHMKGRLYE